MFKVMDGFRIIGDAQKTKAIIGNGIHLYDFMLIYNDKLANLAQSFFPEEKEYHKMACQAVIDLPIARARELIETGHSGTDTMDDIVKYCR